MHPFTNNFENTLSKDSIILADNWIAKNAGTSKKWAPSNGDIEGWSSQQKCVFLEKLTAHAEDAGALSLQTLESMDLVYGLTAMDNSEIKLR
jgi:hypothetical protein